MSARQLYLDALNANTVEALEPAYEQAQRHWHDMRFTAEKRAAAREFLGKLTMRLRAAIEREGLA